MTKCLGLRRKWRLQASLMTSMSSCGPLINKVKGKTHPLSRISSKLSVSLVSIVELLASLKASNNSCPFSWCDGLESSICSSSRALSTFTTVEVGRNITDKTLLRTMEFFGALSRVDLEFEVIQNFEDPKFSDLGSQAKIRRPPACYDCSLQVSL